jgi:hypothetical protein
VSDRHSLGIIWLEAKSGALDLRGSGYRKGRCWKSCGTHFHSCSLNTFYAFLGVVRRSLKLITVVKDSWSSRHFNLEVDRSTCSRDKLTQHERVSIFSWMCPVRILVEKLVGLIRILFGVVDLCRQLLRYCIKIVKSRLFPGVSLHATCDYLSIAFDTQ